MNWREQLSFTATLSHKERAHGSPLRAGEGLRVWDSYSIINILRVLGLLFIIMFLLACESRALDKFVIIDVDGREIQRNTQVATVSDALDEAHIQLGPLDRVTPDLNQPIERSSRITVTRVREEFPREERTLPFPRTLLRDEALPDGTSRVVQLGVNGREELTYKIVHENDVEVSRDLFSQHTLEIPREEIVVVGAKGLLKSVPITGVIFYLSNNNAWLMRDSSSAKRPLTFTGDLDGRAFAVSPDGSRVLFTRRASVGGAVGAVGPLNSLWQVDSRIVGDSATAVAIENVLYADWLSATQIIFSTGERTVGAPGWKAHNDLWSYDFTSKQKQQLLAPLTHVAYAFWGVSFALAPDRKRIVYASADELGFVDVLSGQRNALQQFPVYQTNAGWVWTPDVNWSPDMRFVAATLHAPPRDTPKPELALLFDVWAINTSGTFAAPLAPDSGMFANPLWSGHGRIAYAQARHPRESADDQYDLFVMNVDGGGKQRVFPAQGEHGMSNPQFAWSPDGTWMLALYDGNLFRVDINNNRSSQLTADGGGTQLRWR